MIQNNVHRVVVVGGGFGGLAAISALKGAAVDITVIDQRNHHLFQPLLYQVATTSLSPSEIAWPIRQLLRKRPEVTTLMGRVAGVDRAARLVQLENGQTIPYDSLIIATGARHAYFGHDDWEPYAPGLKTLEDATAMRRRLLMAFEAAEREADPERRKALLTFAIIGAGPTGVELAGTIVALARVTLRDEFRNIKPEEARVVLIEAGKRVLPNFRENLSEYTSRALERLGVEVRLGQAVTDVNAEGVMLGDTRLPANTVI
jgi:NADH dehydrogenase